MNKVKIVKSKGISQLMIKSLKGQQLSEHEVYSINNNEVRGLLHLDVIEKKNAFKLFYNVTGYVTFRYYLRTPLTKASFAAMLQNILDCLLAVKKAYFHQQNMLMDFSQVMVNPATGKIYFVYVPIQGFDSESSLRDFLLNIIQYSTFAPGEDTGYVQDYITILNSGINFSEFELEQYIKNLSGGGSEPMGQIECPNCHIRLPKGTSYCTQCGTKVSGNTSRTDRQVYDPFNDNGDDDEPNGDIERQTPPEKHDRKDNTQGLSDGTTVLGADPGETTVLGSEELDTPNFPYLIRNKNNEKIMVDKPSFRIGKERKYSDYFVSDNNAVSRSHADIITREKRYYIIDLNSTNKTYVDGRAIAIEKEIEIFDGTKLRLANEDFVFYIDDNKDGE